MKIILDPSRDGCTIWFPYRNTLKFIHGDAMDICDRIFKYATYYEEALNEMIQCVEIALDNKGVGMVYQDVLMTRYNLKIDIITLEKEIII